MIHAIIGTKAQFIKMAPILRLLAEHDLPHRIIDLGQHAATTSIMRSQFKVREPDFSFCDSGRGDVATVLESLQFAMRVYSARWRRGLLAKIFAGEKGGCLVHGDTLSTWLGVVLASAARLPVAHVEAGLRSYNWRHPFPEELIRVWVMPRCDLLFAPSDWAFGNLKRMRLRGTCVNLGVNTAKDALEYALAQPAPELPQRPYVLVTCHRFEALQNTKALGFLVDVLRLCAGRWHVVFVHHEPTRRALKRAGRLQEVLDLGIETRPLEGYIPFAHLLRNATLVCTDGGSIQEECFYLDKPCLVLRLRTERPEGIGENARLVGYDLAAVHAAIDDLGSLRRSTPLPNRSPSALVVDQVIQSGWAA